MLTYRQLIEFVEKQAKQNPDVLDQTVTIQSGDGDEFYPVLDIAVQNPDSWFSGVLDPGQLYLIRG